MTTTGLLDCGHPESPHSASTRGYGRDNDGKLHCYDCCHAFDLSQIAAGEPICAYLTRDEHNKPLISNWPGRPLMRVTCWWHRENNFIRAAWDTKGLVWIQAVDADGRRWYGSSPGFGMYCRMRPCKQPKED